MSIADKLTTVAENVPKVYEAGQKNEYDKHWDDIQRNGARTTYNYFYADSTCTDDTLNPKYVIKPETADYMFTFARANSPITLDDTKFDFSNCTSMRYAFSDRNMISHYGRIDVTKCTGSSSLQRAFHDGYGSRIKKSIGTLVCSESTYFHKETFTNCDLLTDITVEGTIGMTITLSDTSLNVRSARSIIRALKDYSGTSKDGTYSIILKDTLWTALDDTSSTDYEAPPSGSSWVDYVTELGWGK